MSEEDLRRAEEIQPGEARLDFVWAAMLASVLLYAALALLVVDRFAVTINREIEGWMLVFLAMTSGLHVLVTLLLRQLIAALSKGRYVVYCIVRWALIEGIAVYGLILSFVGVGIGVTSIFFAVSALLLAATRAGATDRRAFVGQFR